LFNAKPDIPSSMPTALRWTPPGYAPFALILFASFVFFAGLGQRDIVTSHEARVAQTARVMHASGPVWSQPKLIVARPVLIEKSGRKALAASDETIRVNPWVVPILNDQVRLNKPPLPYWFTAVSFSLFNVNEFAARFPAAMLGVIATWLMYQLGNHLFSRNVGMIAAMLWISTHFILDEFRKSMADPYLAFFALLSIVAFLKGGRWILLCWIALALGALSKGPVIFVTSVPAMVILFRWSNHQRRDILRHLIGAILFLAIALPWPVAVIRQVPNALDLWKYDALESQEKSRPFFMYFLNLFQLTLPWTPFWVASLILAFLHKRRGVRTSRRIALCLWMLVIVILFSIKPVKKNAYLLPLMPALLLSTAEVIATLLQVLRRNPKRPVPWILMSITSAISIGLAFATAAFCIRSYPERAIGIIAAIIAILATLPPVVAIVRSAYRHWFMAQAVSFGILITMFLSLWHAISSNARSPRTMAASVLGLSHHRQIPIAVSPSPEEFSFYLPLRMPEWKQSDRILLVLDKPDTAELEDQNFIQSRFDHAVVISWRIVLRDARYVVVEVLLNHNRP